MTDHDPMTDEWVMERVDAFVAMAQNTGRQASFHSLLNPETPAEWMTARIVAAVMDEIV